jgi:ABC-type iron transport system FetAB ATPase subunit
VNENIFIEQAEYISEQEMIRWAQSHPSEKIILKKLSSAGAKLIVGPRGCGKTTLLLKSYALLKRADSEVFPVYVNFKTSLKLEPLYKTNVNASYWFNQWLVLRVYRGIYETLASREIRYNGLSLSKPALDRAIADLETGKLASSEFQSGNLTVGKLQEELSSLLDALEMTRVVLLLDDAAHAFSFAQQRGFFDFFREVKARNISPKAAIYPGVTSFSATFQAGHDAEEIDVWLKPDDAAYLPFMTELVRRRFPKNVFDQIRENEAAFQLVCYCAYGIPRALLNILHEIMSDEDENEQVDYNFNTRKAQRAVKRSLDSTVQIYESLKLKLPIYGNFIDTGSQLLRIAANLIKEYNRDKPINRKSVSIAINTPIPTELAKTLGFLEYAGLIAPKGVVSRGVKGSFGLYGVHYAYLYATNSILSVKAPGIADTVRALANRSAHEFTRAQTSRLLGGRALEDAFALMLPPCQNCGSARSNDSAKFCHQCGAPLKNISIFEELVNQGIEALTLTSRRISSIKEHSNIRYVKDILLDHDHKELLSIPRVGPYWAKRIMSYAEEYIA